MGSQPGLGLACDLADFPVMELKWTNKPLSDLARLFAFLASVNMPAAARAVQAQTAAPLRLLEQPRIGECLNEFEPCEVRCILVGQYEVRYEVRYDIDNTTITVLRLWHTRQDR